MQDEHEKVVKNLTDVNDCYLAQVDENEQLKTQLNQMKMMHETMMSRFDELEKKIAEKQESPK